MASATQTKPRFLTYRVQNIPYGISKEELKGYFYVEDRDDIKVKSLCPCVDTPEGEEGDYTATVFFRPRDDPQREPRIAIDIIDIDRTFNGFTPLYVPPREKGPIAVDIIALSGLAGHAFGSWAHSPEHMWIRDYLPRDAPNARILTYGYPSMLQGNTSISTIQDYTTTFVQSLIGMRDSAECESRPIIFIGHSLGCLIIKKALADIALMGVNSSRLPVRTIIFLAGPHRGLNISAMQTLVKGKATQALVDELGVRSRTLNEINQKFAHVAGDIEILTCYETKPTMTAIEIDGVWVRKGEPALMVELDSAQLYLPRENLISAETDHTQIAKIRKGEGGIYSRVKSAIRQGLVSTARIVASVEVNPDSIAKSNIPSSQDAAPPYSPPQVKEAIPIEHPKIAEVDSQTFITVPNFPRPVPQPEIKSAESDDGICNGDAAQDDTVSIEKEEGEDDEDDEDDEDSEDEDDEDDEDDDIRRFCSVCDRTCRRKELIYYCVECSGDGDDDTNASDDEDNDSGDDDDHDPDDFRYDICQRCFKKGAKCLLDNGDGSHKLAALILRGVEYLDYPDLTLLPSDSDIIKAIKNGDLATLNARTWKKKVINAKNEAGESPLTLAIKIGSEDIFQILLDKGANVEGGEGDTPLELAVRYVQASMVEMLLEYGADVDGTDNAVSSPLHDAVLDELESIVGILLEHGAQVNRRPGHDDDSPPLIVAIEMENLEILEMLLKKKPILDVDENGVSALVTAIGNDISYVRPLLRAGADPNFGNTVPGQSPLFQAAIKENDAIVQLLLQHGALINAENQHGYTPLIWSIRQGSLAACRIILEAGADVNHGHLIPGKSPLCQAASQERADMLQLLIQFGVDLEAEDQNGCTALSWATQAGDMPACRILLDAGANANTHDNDGLTPLMSAAKDQLDIAKLLIGRGAQVNVLSKNSWTALTLAAKLGNLESVQLLVNNGASGRPTPFEYWRDFPFAPNVPMPVRNVILDNVRRVKHIPVALKMVARFSSPNLTTVD